MIWSEKREAQLTVTIAVGSPRKRSRLLAWMSYQASLPHCWKVPTYLGHRKIIRTHDAVVHVKTRLTVAMYQAHCEHQNAFANGSCENVHAILKTLNITSGMWRNANTCMATAQRNFGRKILVPPTIHTKAVTPIGDDIEMEQAILGRQCAAKQCSFWRRHRH